MEPSSVWARRKSGGGAVSPQDGSDWDHALSGEKLAEMLKFFTVGSDQGGAEFWLAGGSYPSLYLHRGTALYGGFDGTEAQRGQRDPSRSPVSIDHVWIVNYTIIPDDFGPMIVGHPDGS